MKEVRQDREREAAEVVEAPAIVEDDLAPRPPRDVADRAGTDADAPDRFVVQTGDHAARWAEVEQILDGRGNPKKLPELMLSLGVEYRARMAARLEDAAKVGRGDDILQLADLGDVTLVEKFRVALSAKTPPTVAAMRAHLTLAGMNQVTTLLEDETVGPALRAWHKGPAAALLPQLGNIDDAVAFSVPTLRWIIATTPAEQVAYAIFRGLATSVARQFADEGDDALWSWLDGIDAALVYAFPVSARGVASHVPEARRARLEALLANVAPAEVVADDAAVDPDADPAPIVPAKKEDTEALVRLLAAKKLDVQAVLDAAAPHGPGVQHLVAAPHHRKRIVAAATPEQVLRLGALIGLVEHEHLEWMLDTPGVEPAHVALAYATWAEPHKAFADYRMRARLRKRWGDSHRPIEVFGQMFDTLVEIAVDSPGDAEWMFERATPVEILYAVTHSPSNTTKYCKTLEKSKIGYGWVRGLGAGVEDPYLRVLAANCPDADTAKFVRDRLLGDYAGWFKEEDTVADVPAGAYDRGSTRLSVGMAGARDAPESAAAADLDTRVAELSPQELANLRDQPGRLQQVLERAPEADRPRIIFDAEPTLAQLVAVTPAAPALQLVAYLRTRPEAEHVEALADPTVAAGLRERFPRNPLALFPVLGEPAKLAAVLAGNPAFVTWLLTDAAAGPALHALGHREVLEAAAEALAAEPAAVRRIPSGELLDADARRAVERLRDHAPDDRLTRTLTERLDEVPGGRVDDAAEAAERAEQKPLWDALGKLLDDGAPVASLLTVCEQRRHEAGKLFKDAKHDDLVARLAAATGLSPLVVFSGLPWDGLLYSRSARDWLLTSEPGWAILDSLAPGEPGVAKLAKLMDDLDGPAVNLLAQLPDPAGLKDGEARGLRLLFDACTTYLAQSRLFFVRWGAQVDGNYNQAEMGRLWTLMQRLPSAHVEQFAVKDFVSEPSKKEVLGLYGSQGIALYDKLLDVDDQTLYGEDEGVPRAQFQQIHGLTDEQFEKKLGKSIEEREVEGAKVYVQKAVPIDAFTAVALHEIGHAVDDMMGQRTELAFGMAGWREHASAEFDEWAEMLGGWDRVPQAARVKIREAWQMFLNSSGSIDGLDRSVASMCSPEHPIRDPKLRGVGVVDMAMAGKTGHRDPYFAGGRMWIINHHRKTWLSANEDAMRASPSDYGRSAPAEFFAECYVDYYRNYDGKNPSKKGGKLAPWIKDWFDTNVDNLTFNPARDRTDEAGDGG